MELKIENRKLLTQNDVSATRELYNRYGNLLLGYITKVVRDNKLAEEYLVDVFIEVPYRLSELINTDKSTWLGLQQLAKQKLAGFTETLGNCSFDISAENEDNVAGDKYLNVMNAEQRYVFCGIYYHQQSIAVLAQELRKTEQDIKLILREAFNIIRNG